MTYFQQLVSRPHRRAATIMGCIVSMVTLLAGPAALSQDQSAATAKDAIFARKILMSTIGTHMDDITSMTTTGKIDLDDAQDDADTISVMLMAFPHLFPAATNQWKPGAVRDPGTDTYASPDVWTRYAEFYKQAADASKLALNASRADTVAEFKTLAAQLQATCNACHAAFQKKD